MRRKAIAAGVSLALAGCATVPTDPQRPRVALETSAGRIVLALDAQAAPVSSCNFIGYVVFGDVPSVAMLVGAAVIILAGLYIFLRERDLVREEPVVVPPPG